ncbi:hypothetical protein BJ978_001280 [Agromyces terreus]|uniref:Uncharacterized protein n=1 Tax=Agromyces terreus TaxID=424795 RepID=A0A9X2H734_9MICO|nr:hypothetical protein [Agromyces terreus]
MEGSWIRPYREGSSQGKGFQDARARPVLR